MQMLFGGSTKEKNIEMSNYINPMEKNSVNKALKQQERKKKMQKVRRKLSIGAKNARNVAEAAKINMSKRKSFIKIENHDGGGGDYFQNVETGETFRFQCSKVACGIPFTFWNLFAFLWCCCFRGKCQWPYCGAATFVPRVGVWEVDEESWEANYVDLKELARRKASSVGGGMKSNVRSWSNGGD